ncbi:MAG: UDP-3-O-(3-hydroxymyristoyl)glucosamine N-acyltransferase [Ferruginibacter sp.]
MKFPSPVSVEWLGELIEAKITGNKNGFATGINELHKVEPGDVVFVDHPKYYDKCLQSAATFIIINKDLPVPEGKTLLICEQPFMAYSKIINHFRPFEPADKMISDTAVIGEGTYIYPSAFVGHHVSIGKNCMIHPHVSIMPHCIIGDNVIIQANSVIGSDGFYYNTKKTNELWYTKMPSCGRVILEDQVEIGAGCTIDRGVSHDTILGKGTKLDNLVHIGHDTVVGRNGLMAAQVAIAGVVDIGNGVTLWGQCGISKTLSIGDNAVLLAKSGVASSLEGDKVYWGTPVEEASVKRRELVWIRRIPEMWEKLKDKK